MLISGTIWVNGKPFYLLSGQSVNLKSEIEKRGLTVYEKGNVQCVKKKKKKKKKKT